MCSPLLILPVPDSIIKAITACLYSAYYKLDDPTMKSFNTTAEPTLAFDNWVH